MYAVLFGTTAATVWHPVRALDIATTGYYHTTSSIGNISSLWNRKTVTEKVQQQVNESVVLKDDLTEPESTSGESLTSVIEEFVVIDKADIENVVDEVRTNVENFSEVQHAFTDELIQEGESTESVSTSMESTELESTRGSHVVQKELKIVERRRIEVDVPETESTMKNNENLKHEAGPENS